MTIQDIYELIKQKKENAINDFKRLQLENLKKGEEEQRVILPTLQMARIKGQEEAYTDVLCLIESSGILDTNKYLKAVETMAKNIEVDMCSDEWYEVREAHKLLESYFGESSGA